MAANLPPPPIQEKEVTAYVWQEWFRQVRSFLTDAAGAISWNAVDKTGANITDIPTRLHNSLQSSQGGTSGEFYHLTNTEHTKLGNLVTQTIDGTPAASAATTTHKIPIKINGTTYYMLLSNV